MTHGAARTALLALVAAAAIVYDGRNHSAETAQVLKSGPAISRVILQVINRHFTVGKRISSVYLRVFSNGAAECHTEKYWDEPDTVKTKVLAAKDFEALNALLEQPELLSVNHRYERMYPVIDSWMEWDIEIYRAGGVQTIEVAGFSPAAANQRNQPYPDALVRLGCSVWKLRDEVYGDEQAAKAAQSAECNAGVGVR